MNFLITCGCGFIGSNFPKYIWVPKYNTSTLIPYIICKPPNRQDNYTGCRNR